jgi:hypothetical protein
VITRPSDGWRQPSTRRLLCGVGTLLLNVGLGVSAAGCGGTDRAEAAFTPVTGTESAYCDTYRAWQVHELDGGTGDDQPNPAAFRAYWKDYLEFNETSVQQAPAEIRDEWIVSDRAIRTVLTPVLEKYGFDVQRIAREGTAAEKALGEPTSEAQKAQDAIHAYEDRVCGVATPPAANVAFKADASSQSYCAALGDFNRGFEKVESSRFDPGVMQSVVTADGFSESLDELKQTAPDDIAADQDAVSEWFRRSWSEVVAENDYDIRRIWLDGTPEDRAVFTFSHPDVLDHHTRLTAYEEKVCAK